MRERRVEGPAGPAGRGERVPPQRPVVRTPAAAQGIRSVDETGALTGVTSTRASEDSPVEVTGPIDWSSSVLPAVTGETPAPAGVSGETGAVAPAPARPGTATDPAGTPAARVVPAAPETPAPVAPATPARRSVLSAGRAPVHAWEAVSGEGRGATVPDPGLTEVPDVEGVFDVAAPDVEVAEGIDVSGEASGQHDWATWLRRGLLALVGVGIGIAIFLIVR
ncbi:hypothetical protein [Serinibacter arcticus]|nr:hypothetical protein [Serinibacter arcticus]